MNIWAMVNIGIFVIGTYFLTWALTADRRGEQGGGILYLFMAVFYSFAIMSQFFNYLTQLAGWH